MLIGLCLLASPALGADRSEALTRARFLYNEGQYEAALNAAEEGRRVPEHVNSADLIAARAYLEKFRESRNDEDLARARERLNRLDPSQLDADERIELVVGLGEALYFDGAAGAASEVFDSVLDGYGLSATARERVLDWWASALDEDARRRADGDRPPVYQRIRERMRSELALNSGSATALYWLTAAARGEGNLQAAWDAARAGWVRSALTPGRGSSLRGDIDHLVVRAIVPESARATGRTADDLLAEWEQFKVRWNQQEP